MPFGVVLFSKFLFVTILENSTAKISTEGSPSMFWRLPNINKIDEIWQAFKIDSQARFWGRCFGGSNVADFWLRTSYMLILLDLLLKKISETWGPSESSLEKSLKSAIFVRKWIKIIFFDSGSKIDL